MGRAAVRLRAGGLGVLVVPAAVVGALGTAVAVAPLGRSSLPVTSRLELVTLALAAGTAPALVEPGGGIADATPTGRLQRRASRIGAAAAAAVAALVVVRIAAPPGPGQPALGGALAELGFQVALVAAVGALASRRRPEAVATAGAAAVSVLAGSGPEMARLADWSLDAQAAGTGRLLALTVVALLAFAVASRDPARR